MKSLFIPITLSLLLASPTPAAGTACSEIAGILDEAVEEWPDLLSTQRVKPRMAAVKIATSAGIAVNYANDAGWSAAEKAPVIALRDTRERDYDDTFTKAAVPAILLGYLNEIGAVLAVKCPDTGLADISGLSTDYPDS